MLSQVIIFLIFFLSVILQVSFFPNIIPLGIAPDFVAIIIIFWSARSGFDATWKWAILAGMMLDVSYYWPIGINIISLAFISFIASSLAKRFLVSQTGLKFMITAFFVLAGTIGHNLITSTLLNFKNGQNIIYGLSFLISEAFFLKIIFNLILFAIFYVPLKKLEKLIALYESRVKFAR